VGSLRVVFSKRVLLAEEGEASPLQMGRCAIEDVDLGDALLGVSGV